MRARLRETSPDVYSHLESYVTPNAMDTKLTLRLDAQLIRRAKAYAKRSGKSVSAVVADYFAALEAEDAEVTMLGPKVRSLIGVLREHPGDEQAYRRHLEKKHR